LARWNELPQSEAEQEALSFCGSMEWAKRLCIRRPYSRTIDVLAEASEIWWSLDPSDWLDAFAHHPRIGEAVAAKANAQSLAWSGGEQAGVSGAEATVLQSLAEGNRAYEAKFGRTYIVSASGKSAEELLHILERRLLNSPEQELREAAEQQAAIIVIRLKKWLDV
jgi:OHCU decarboxylase